MFLTLLRWKSLPGHGPTGRNRQTRQPRKSPRTFRPRLEALEDRLAPAILTVNTAADETTADNFLSLREAIAVVDSGSTNGLSAAEMKQISGTLGINDTIRFDHSLQGQTITLTSGHLAITKNLVIVGLGPNQLAI